MSRSKATSPVLFSVVAVVAAVIVVLASSPSDAAGVVAHDYVGAQRCKSCHAAEFAALENGPHARAYDVLDDAAKKNPRCLACHTMVPEDTQLGLTGIQCESCHGAGRNYTPEYVMRDKELSSLLNLVAKPDATSCTRCHTDQAPTMTPFAFSTAKARIQHWQPRKP
jgi:hypothetical protein